MIALTGLNGASQARGAESIAGRATALRSASAQDREGALVAVVIPVYNAAVYLDECLSSVLAQTHNYLELVCVDDGSTDDSLEVLTRIAATDPRMRVIPRPHRGPSAARNTGIDAARGDFLTFVDSDDTVSPDLIARLLDRIGAQDLVVSGWAGEPRVLGRYIAVYDGLRHGLLNTTSKLYRLGLIRSHGVRFDEDLAIGEDVEFNIRCLLAAGGAAVIPNELYQHRRRPHSLTTSYRASKHEDLRLLGARLRALTETISTPELDSLLNYLGIRNLISAGLNLFHEDSTVSASEARSLMHDWPVEAGPLPVGGRDPNLRGTYLLYRLLGLRRVTWMAKQAKDLKRRVRRPLFRNRRRGL